MRALFNFFPISAVLAFVISFHTGDMAIAQDATIQSMRDRQDELMDRYNFNAEKAELLRGLVEEGRTYVVLLPDDEFYHTTLATKEEAGKYWKIMTLKHHILMGRPLDEDALRDMMNKTRSDAKNIADEFEREIPELLARNKLLKQEWRTLENQIAELMQVSGTGSGGTVEATQTKQSGGKSCVALTEIVLADKPLSQAANASSGAQTHSVSHKGEFNGHPINVTLEWSAPPARLCEGDEFQLSVSATNAVPTQKGMSLNYVASVRMGGASEFVKRVSCSNAPTWIDLPEDTAVVRPGDTNHTNNCRYKVIRLPAPGAPQRLIEADFGAHTGGSGKVIYRYEVP